MSDDEGRSRTIYSFQSFDPERAELEISNVKWENIIYQESLEDSYNNFIDKKYRIAKLKKYTVCNKNMSLSIQLYLPQYLS